MKSKQIHPLRRASALPLLAALAFVPGAMRAQEQAAPASTESHVTETTVTAPALPAIPGVSQVRIVRLSQVNGPVQLDRGNGKPEVAFVNLPIIAGERLQTGEGLAEVEFEDNSSIRLTPHTAVEFTVLGRTASGSTTSTVKLISGSLYASMVKSKGTDVYSVLVGNKTIGLTPASHLRIDATSPTAANVTVFKGSVPVSGSDTAIAVNKNKILSFNPSTASQPTLARATEEPAPYDLWDKNSTDYHSARVASSLVGSGYTYGLSDLNYYGSFSNAGGCGSLWRPYLVSSAWDPYGSGIWSYYGGSGYSWVSPYPWGWTPFHSGSWQYCNGSGWGWRPQPGSWNGLANHPAFQPINGPHLPRPVAPRPPSPGQPSLVPVNLKAIPVSHPATDGSFAFRGDSAGLGVPRGVFANLGKLSHAAEQHSFAPTPIRENQLRPGVALANSSVGNAHQGGASPQSFRSDANNSSHANVANRSGSSEGGRNTNSSYSGARNSSSSYEGGGRNSGFSGGASHASAPSPSFSAPSSAPAVSSGAHK